MKVRKLEKSLRGQIKVPGDKSISHRSIILGSLGKGTTRVKGFLKGDDCQATIDCFRKMGVEIKINKKDVKIKGVGLQGLKKPEKPLYAGNSGTTIRLLAGVLAGQNFPSTITGDDSLVKRPMDRIATPLIKMGGKIKCRENKYPPLEIHPVNTLNSLTYNQKKASAQVKSAILLAGLYTNEKIKIIQPEISRNHTEKMFKAFDIPLKVQGKEIVMEGIRKQFDGREIQVPGDISSAAFYIVAASIIKGSDITIKDLGINETRTGIIDVMEAMGADISISNIRVLNEEKIGDIRIKSSELKAVTIEGEIIPRIIDEIPIIALAANFAEGKTIIKDAEELKVKETNRIEAVCKELKKMGANIIEKDDGMEIIGGEYLKAAEVHSYNDHRIAMMLAVAGYIAEGETFIHNFECVNISNPDFIQIFNKLINI